MQYRELGRGGPTVSALGLGCMAMSEFYGPHDDEQSINTIRRALDLGINFLDTADVYGRGKNEELVGRAIRGRRSKVVLATKFGIVRNEDPQARGVNAHPKYVKSCCDASLKRLAVDTIDLYYQHRVDPVVPIQDTIGAMAELVQAGKVRFLGMSEAAPETLRRAAAVHPITALQSEYSLWTRDPEQEVLGTCRELGVGFVAYSPLGRGFLAGQVRRVDDLAQDDWRRFNPRFERENLGRNLALVEQIEQFAAKKGCTPAQLALAWLLARGDDIVPIPGTRRVERLEENVRAMEVRLTPEDMQRLDGLFPAGAAAGTRYPEAMMGLVNR
jgi:aryl-alcohol dehydrogenase-like predicted oxidoreductase